MQAVPATAPATRRQRRPRPTREQRGLAPEHGVMGAAKPTGVLSPAEESELVKAAGAKRKELTSLIRPLLADAPADVRLDHFDQIVAYYGHLERVPAKLAGRIRKGLAEYNDIRHKLVLANLPWVTKLARSQRPGAISNEDLFQEGVCGLLKAIDRFEPERGLRLMTYATWYIREAMQQIRARQSHTVSLSSHDQTLLGRVEANRTAFQHENERAPSAFELSQSVRKTAKQLGRLQMATTPPVSLERSGGDGTIPVPTDDPTLEFDRLEAMHSAVHRLLDALPTRERMVVTRRFGLDGHEPTSLEVLGGDLNVSKERVRQLQRQALRRMHEHAVNEQLEVSFD